MAGAYVSATQIIKDFKIPRSTLYRLAATGKIPARETTRPWHVRRHWEFDPAEVARALGVE